jgi:hypothetical protein
LVRVYDHIGGPEVAGIVGGVTFVTEGEARVDLFLAEAGTAAAFLSSHA